MLSSPLAELLVLLLLTLLDVSLVNGNVAYPGIWTGRQPNGQSTGTEQLLLGTAEYHYTIVETESSYYVTVRDTDNQNRLVFAQLNPQTGRYEPSQHIVGQVQPDDDPSLAAQLAGGVDNRMEAASVIHAQCLESDFCLWKLQQEEKREAELRRNSSPSGLLGGTLSPKTGQVTNLIVPIMFKNHAESEQWKNERVLTPLEVEQELFNGAESSVRHFFQQESYGQFELISELAVTDWIILPFTEKECAAGQSGLSYTFHECLGYALEHLVTESNLDLSSFLESTRDKNSITFLHSGYGAEYGGNDVENTWYQDRIWSHAWEITSSPHYEGPYAVISDKYGRTNREINRVGVAVHELGQAALQLPTLYGREYPRGYGLGYYDAMANPWGFDGTLLNCGSLSPYTKALMGWVLLEPITEAGEYQLEESVSSNKVYLVNQGFGSNTEYLLIENRQEAGYDQGLSQPGLAIYHVDELASNIPSSPANGNFHFPYDHYIVSLLQADGQYDLETWQEEGDTGDLFHAGRFSGIGQSGVLTSDGGNVAHDDPSLQAYQSGVMKETGITITNISAPNKVMTFRIDFVQS